MLYLGDVKLGRTLRFAFDTQADGLPSTLSGITVRVYKDANTVETGTGVAITADYDTRTGLNLVVVDTSADPFYVAGSDYIVVLTAGTVNGQAIMRVLGNFSIENRTIGFIGALAVQAIWDALTAALVTAGSIGKLLVDNINATIGSRLATAGYTAPDNASITAIKGVTDTLSLNGIADAILKRDFAAVAGAAARSLLNAARFLRNKRSVAGGTLTVTAEDDVTPAWTAVVVTAAGDPVSSVDPN
jgi:hypothetical protein